MDGATTEIVAEQLVYANVEKARSGSQQRGFQVWLYSSGLTDSSLRTQVEDRLKKYTRPALPADARKSPLPTRDASEVPGPDDERYVFDVLPDGRAIVARCVPRPGTIDRFGRGGLFHAHALVIAPDQFAQVGNDPFRILDAGFRFQSSPDEFTGSPSERLPPTRLKCPPSRVVEDDTEAWWAARVPELVGWLVGLVDGSPAEMFAVAAASPGVLALARRVIHALPPSVRPWATFDTLYPGTGNQRYRVAGAAALPPARWVEKDHQTLAPTTRVLRLPTVVNWRGALAAAWVSDADLTDDDRERSLELAGWLLEVGESPRARPSDRVVSLVGRLPGAEAAWNRVVAAIVRRDVDGHLRELPAVEAACVGYFGPWSEGALHRLRVGLTPDVLAGYLLEILEAQTTTAPDPGFLAAVANWSALPETGAGDRVRKILARWATDHETFAKVCLRALSIDGSGHPPSWYRDWCIQTLPPDWQTPETGVALATHLCRLGTPSGGSMVSPEDGLRAAEMAYRLYRRDPSPEVAEWLDRLELSLAARGRVEFPGAAATLQRRPDLVAWVLREWEDDLRTRCRLSFDAGACVIGVEVSLSERGLLRPALFTQFRETHPDELYAAVAPFTAPQGYSVDPNVRNDFLSANFKDDYQYCREADLATRLANASDTIFAQMANLYLFDKRRVGVRREGYESIMHSSYLLGWRVFFEASDRDTVERVKHLLRALVLSVVPERGVERPTSRRLRFAHRLEWLLMRLCHQDTTHDRGLNAP